jgi:hypothetical protein
VLGEECEPTGQTEAGPESKVDPCTLLKYPDGDLLGEEEVG